MVILVKKQDSDIQQQNSAHPITRPRVCSITIAEHHMIHMIIR